MQRVTTGESSFVPQPRLGFCSSSPSACPSSVQKATVVACPLRKKVTFFGFLHLIIVRCFFKVRASSRKKEKNKIKQVTVVAVLYTKDDCRHPGFRNKHNYDTLTDHTPMWSRVRLVVERFSNDLQIGVQMLAPLSESH
jgi:hypothetical protein